MRKAAESLGFGLTDVTRLVTAASELAHNIFCHAGKGFLLWINLQDQEKHGLELTFIDEGPGITDIEQAMQPGYSTRSRHGMGLLGAKLLVDELTIASQAGKGTTVTVRKWRTSRSLVLVRLMNEAELQQRWAEDQETIRILQGELAETNRGLVALNLELEWRGRGPHTCRDAHEELGKKNMPARALDPGTR